jgi:hypothetical protein
MEQHFTSREIKFRQKGTKKLATDNQNTSTEKEENYRLSQKIRSPTKCNKNFNTLKEIKTYILRKKKINKYGK